MIGDYNHSKIEKKWQAVWQKNKIYEPNLKRAKNPFYNLMMFPYPSAEGLHIGNMYAFAGADIYGRFMRMKGKDVFEPIGLDGFGIHSENYALKIGKHPMKQAKVSEKRFYEQFKSIGNGFAWNERLETYDPEYYKWTQWIFTQMFKHGLAYRKKAEVNWCTGCKTVLADEQVLQKTQNTNSKLQTKHKTQIPNYKQEIKKGVCERCDTEVIKKELEQWFFRITNYAERLLKDLGKIYPVRGREGLRRASAANGIDWSEKVKIAQRNWIGKSEGALIKFQITNHKFQTKHKSQITNSKQFIEVFTTRPDTIFGATFLALNPEHPTIKNYESRIMNYGEIKDYIKKATSYKLQATDSKTGVELKGIKAINPANGEEIPIWVSDYVLEGYGTGAIMAVPAHDQRDFEFAKKFNLAIKMVICPNYPAPICPVLDKTYEGEGYLVGSGRFDGIPSEKAKTEIVNWLSGKELAEKKTTYRLRDWLISRQRYWGPPIPMIFCRNCKKSLENYKLQVHPVGKRNFSFGSTSYKLSKGELENPGWIAVPEKDLPVKLPFIKNFKPLGKGESPLASAEKFYKTKCPKCGGHARRETDVSDTFLDSSWYYYGYLSKFENYKLKIENSPFSNKLVGKWCPVDMYIGGAEHAVLHLLYTRFITKVFYDWKLINFQEPFKTFRAHGLIIKDGAKMSKSKGNVVNPDEYIKKFGADALRMYLMFLGPFEQGGDFRDEGMRGITRFLERVWKLNSKLKAQSSKPQLKTKNYLNLEKILHQSIKKITEDVENLRYNTAISQMMILLNEIEKNYSLLVTRYWLLFLKLLSPFTPYIAEELWLRSGNNSSIHKEKWPKYDAKKIKEETFELVVQINGKKRDQFFISNNLSKEEIKKLTIGREKVKNYLAGGKPQEIIYVPNKIINIVLPG